MVAAFDYCLHGKGGAAPSIDTAMHGLVDAAHVDHLHPDSGIAIATAADGEELTKEIFGDKVVWVPWRRPGFQLGLDIAAIKEANPQAIGCILGGHGITAWGDTSRGGRGQLAVDHRHRRARTSTTHGKPEPFGPPLDGYAALPGGRATRQGRRAGAAHPRPRLAPTGRRSGTSPTTDAVLEFLARAEHPRLAALGTSLPRPLPAHQGQAAGARPARRRRRSRTSMARLEGAARGLPRGLPGLLRPARRPRTRRRCAARTRRSCWCPASGCSPTARTSRPPGWPASSTSTRST